MSSFQCNYCDKTYSHKSSLCRHVSTHHADDKENEDCEADKKKSFWCTSCDSGFSTAAPLLHHMQQFHNYLVVLKTLSFVSFNAFLEWKEEEEIRSSARYVQMTKPRTCGDGTVTYYFYCSRSGIYKPKGHNERALKTQGTRKVNSYCTSHIKAKQLTDFLVEVEYCSNHHNHEKDELKDLAHLTLPRHVKLLIASKIHQGVAVERILDDVRDSITYGDTPNRDHLTSKKDIYNIRKTLNVQNIQKHISDPKSVEIWVSQLQENEYYNPVLHFKQQGVVDENSQLDKDDFLLCVQTEFQCDMLKEFGNKAICMDATHGTNQNSFLLITILVIDEFGEGIPVAFAISNRETQTTLQLFLGAVLERSGELAPSIFMSDDAIQYWNAWKETYGENSTKKYLCSWHVDKSWRRGLERHVKHPCARAEIYAKLRVIMVETVEKELMTMTQHLMSYLTLNYIQFAEYFRKTYLNRITEWSTFHRIGTLLNTNMHIEAFHRVLKYTYLGGKQNKRIDSLLNALFKIARDKWFERVQKCSKGKLTHRIVDINKRHEKAIELESTTIIEKDGNSSWKVCSTSSNTNYVVEQQSHECKCSVKCRHCGVCAELFTCSCVDFAIHSTACKHIHLVTLANKEIITNRSTTITDHSQMDQHSSDLHDGNHHSSEILKQQEIKRLRQKIITQTNEVQMAAQLSSSASTLSAAISHLTSAKLILKSEPTSNLLTPSSNTIPHNAMISKQRYCSTKRKRSTSTVHSLLKPTDEEIKKIKCHMSNTCSICCQEDPPELSGLGEGSEVMWIECPHCSLWFHSLCVSDGCSSDDFMCFLCKRNMQPCTIDT